MNGLDVISPGFRPRGFRAVFPTYLPTYLTSYFLGRNTDNGSAEWVGDNGSAEWIGEIG